MVEAEHVAAAGAASGGRSKSAKSDQAGGGRAARDIMHEGATCVSADKTLEDAARMMKSMDIGALPICDSDERMIGILTDRDIVTRCVADGRAAGEITCGEVAGGTPRWIADSAGDDEVLREMTSHRIRRLPVIDRERRMVGMISEADIVRNMSDAQLVAFCRDVYARA